MHLFLCINHLYKSREVTLYFLSILCYSADNTNKANNFLSLELWFSAAEKKCSLGTKLRATAHFCLDNEKAIMTLTCCWPLLRLDHWSKSQRLYIYITLFTSNYHVSSGKKTHLTIYKTSLHEQNSANINHSCVNDYPHQGKYTFLSDSSHLCCSGRGGLPFRGATCLTLTTQKLRCWHWWTSSRSCSGS